MRERIDAVGWGVQRLYDVLSTAPDVPDGERDRSAAWPAAAAPVVCQLASVGAFHTGGGQKAITALVRAVTAGGGPPLAPPRPPRKRGPNGEKPASVAAAAPPPLTAFNLIWPDNRAILESKYGLVLPLNIAGQDGPETLRRLSAVRWEGACGRAHAIGHAKIFCRYDAASRRPLWVLVGSHNLSRPAW